jgi:class 3 adenylate cyclase
MLNERQDYFGQTVNIAARVQSLSTSQEIHITEPVIEAPGVAGILEKQSIKPIQKRAALRGIADRMVRNTLIVISRSRRVARTRAR